MPASTAPLTVGLISLGCAKNLVDAQTMVGDLIDHGIVLAPSPEEADIVLVNTCAFIESAREESVDAILDACRLKTEGNCRGVLVAGCMSQRYREELHVSLPEVDAFVGLDQLDHVGDIILKLGGSEQAILDISEEASRLYEPSHPELSLTGGPFGYLKVAEGCNHACAFCAIPAIRGRHRSRPVNRLVAEAESLLDAGVRELDLISQDITFYGRDLRDGSTLPGLLRALSTIGGEFWIRLLYGYPSHVTDELLASMAELPQVCHYLDIPIQHSHPDILKAMHRAETVEAVRTLAARARAVMPDIALRTTCLVGFPGETEGHFQHLLDFVEETEFDHLGTFTFSPEEGTAAATMPHSPPAELAEERRDRLMTLQQTIVAARTGARVGQEARVLLDRRLSELDFDDELLADLNPATMGSARSRAEAPEVDGEILIEGLPDHAEPGTFLSVRYTEALGYDMAAIPVDAP